MKKAVVIFVILALILQNSIFVPAAYDEKSNVLYKNGKLCVNISNLDSKVSEFILFLSAYGERKNLISVVNERMYTRNADADGNIYMDCHIASNAHTYKVMLWDDYSSLRPLVSAVEKENHPSAIKTLDIYNDEDIKRTADELFSNINPGSKNIRYIYDEYSAGNYLIALGLFRNYMIDNLRKTPADISGNAWGNGYYNNPIQRDLLDTMVGYMTLEEANGGIRTTIDACGALNYIDGNKP